MEALALGTLVICILIILDKLGGGPTASAPVTE